MTSICLIATQTLKGQTQRYCFLSAGTIMTIVGLLMLIKYSGGPDLKIDRIFFEPLLGINRMPITTSFNFLLLGFILLSYSSRYVLASIFKIIILLISVYALFAYLYNFIGIYENTLHNPMAIHTAFLFCIISIYLLVKEDVWNRHIIEILRVKKLFIPIVLILIFSISMLLAGGVSVLVNNNLEQQSNLQFKNQTGQIAAFVESRMNLYIGSIYGLQGLFAASNSVTESEWKAYVSEINVPTRYPGVSATSFAPKVFLEEATRLPFKIYPSVTKEYYFPISYVSNFVQGTSTAQGFDLSSESERFKTLSKAIDTDTPSATPVVIAAISKVPIFSVYAPVFKNKTLQETIEDRQKNIQGIVSVSFRLDKIFPDLFSTSITDDRVNIEIYDTPSAETMQKESLLYDTNITSIQNVKHKLQEIKKIYVADRVWMIKFTANKNTYLPVVERYGQEVVLVLGLLFSILITMITYIYIRSHEQALLSKNVQLEALVKSFPFGVLIEDEYRKITLGNAKMMNIFGITGEQKNFVGIPVLQAMELIRPNIKDYDEFKRRDLDIVKKYDVVVDEKIELANDIVISRSYIPLYYHEKLHGAMWIYKDITEEEQIDRMKTEFVSLASHQLRTPLTSIKWYSELIEDEGKMTKTQKSYIHEIREASDRMVSLVGSLLNVSRLELGTFAIEPEKADLLEVVEVAVREAQMNFDLKKQKLTYTHPEKLSAMMLDTKVTHIIIQNLLSNACKYTPENGSINLEIKKVIAKNGVPTSIQISCADNGYGIPIQQQGSVFKKLFRADNVRVLDVEGTGLGLYIIKTVVEAAGCTISFTSQENKGTTFTVTLPLKGMVPRSGKKSLSEAME
ncbi:CHASE domain-containing protein [Arenimonas sp.]|nr:CHASE domain-containing protein [Candidatus Parcubacteria bacterium]